MSLRRAVSITVEPVSPSTVARLSPCEFNLKVILAFVGASTARLSAITGSLIVQAGLTMILVSCSLARLSMIWRRAGKRHQPPRCLPQRGDRLNSAQFLGFADQLPPGR